MSSDDTIVVLPSPTKDGGVEYRVAHCQAAENIDNGLEQEVLYFGNCQVYTDQAEAFEEAHRIEDSIGYVEYGVCILEQRDHPFPTMTVREAEIEDDMWWFRNAPQATQDEARAKLEEGYRFCSHWRREGSRRTVTLSNDEEHEVTFDFGGE